MAVLVALGLSACGTDDDAGDAADTEMSVDEAGEMPVEMTDEAEPADEAAGGTRAGDGADRSGAEAVGESDAGDPAAAPPGQATGGSKAPSAPLDLDGIGRAIAVEAGVTIGTPNIRDSVDDTLEVVRRNNASVFDAQVDIGDARDDGSIDGSGRIIVKVPPADLDPLVADLDGTAGTLIGRTQQSEDVTEQLVDLDIRIRVEEQTIAQFEALLAEATEFQDIVTIQSVITEHTIALERLLASQRNVEQRVDLSTLTIDLVYRPPAESSDEPVISDDDGIADAFREGWDAFVGVVFAVGLVLAVAAPFLGLAALVLGVVWLIARRRPRHQALPGTAARATDHDERISDDERVSDDERISEDDQLVGPTPRA